MWRVVFAGLVVLSGLVLGGLLYVIGGSVVQEVGTHLPTAAAPEAPAEEPAPAPRPAWMSRETRTKTPIKLPYAKATEPPPEMLEVPPSEPETPKRYFRVVVQDAGTLKAGKTTIRLAGVQALSPDETCPGAAGKRWPCGRRGRSALRRLIRAKAVDCAAVARPEADVMVARCKLGRVDINEWVVRQGWARPGFKERERYAAARDAATKAGRGLWRTAPQ